MKLLVCGSRTWADDLTVIDAILGIIAGSQETEFIVIEGGAAGADQAGARAAGLLGIPVCEYPANWSLHGRAAGPIRNQQMLDQHPDLVLAFWDGQSPGTRDMLHRAAAAGVPTKIVTP